jgi:hypothetical protein
MGTAPIVRDRSHRLDEIDVRIATRAEGQLPAMIEKGDVWSSRQSMLE